jgi:Universal stress protein UspA and related nucleotide-binding proteins
MRVKRQAIDMEGISYNKIMVPTDGSEYSYRAAEHAVYLARLAGARVYVLYVIDTDLAFRSGIHYAEDVSGMEGSARNITGKIKQLCEQAGVPCEEIIAKGKPADVIVDLAGQNGVDLIVMGSLGMSAIERALIGSVSDKVSRHAKCPVMIVHGPKSA